MTANDSLDASLSDDNGIDKPLPWFIRLLPYLGKFLLRYCSVGVLRVFILLYYFALLYDILIPLLRSAYFYNQLINEPPLESGKMVTHNYLLSQLKMRGAMFLKFTIIYWSLVVIVSYIIKSVGDHYRKNEK